VSELGGVRHDYTTIATVVKRMREQGYSERAIKNVLRFYGVDVK